VNLPHTWNSVDGQDGGNDYFRGKCIYKKRIRKEDLPRNDRYFLEINGANSECIVYANGVKIATHEGGYSTFRADITESLREGSTELALCVDNSPNDYVYPQMADFTFYGGLYRDVNIISVAESHFELEYYGGDGIKVTPTVAGGNARVDVELFIKNMHDGDHISYKIFDKENNCIIDKLSQKSKELFTIYEVNLWSGRKNPYLYRAECTLIRDGRILDKISARFGCRSFRVDSERGFILNGEEYSLRGVSRHQDRLGLGNALLPEHHREDMSLILELGANTVRLAHYQHDKFFYDLCDEEGLVVWAEIPYISKHLTAGRENTLSQLTELIVQNYNHPSICFWGLSNEITMGGEDSTELIENHRALDSLAHELDNTRLTAIACLTTCKPESEYVKIPDVVAYNHYFGWYGGDTSMNGPWFDKFHKTHPNIPIGVSEYGCEGLNFHSAAPEQGDYTEEYQAYYHEELIKQLFTRKYLFATYVWNMFDFGADARAEGGEHGQNHKGLVTFDRTYKKDAFYAYKAWLSDEPFVHIAGKRFEQRVEEVTTVTVYSNLPTVELFLNGESLGKQSAKDRFFRFRVPNKSESRIVAIAGDCRDEAYLKKVDEPNPDYRLKEKGAVLNWFDVEAPKGRLSLNDKISEIEKTEAGRELLSDFFGKIGEMADGFKLDGQMSEMMGGFTLLRLSGMLGMMNVSFTKEELLELNRRLNSIEKQG